MRKAKLALLLSVALPGAAFAQSDPGLTYGQVPTADQWNSYFAAKNDYLGYTPLNLAGGIMTGPLITTASIAAAAGFNVTPGTAPSSPNNGDVWVTNAGIFVRINGVTQELTPISGSGAFALTGATNTFLYNQIINLNSTNPLPVALSGDVLQAAQVNGTFTRIELDSFANSAVFTCARGDGSSGTLTAVQSGEELCAFDAFGYNGAAYSSTSIASLRMFAAQNFATGSLGTYLRLATTAIGSTTRTDRVSIENDGGVTIPPTVTGGDKGAGSVNVSALYINGNQITIGGNLTTTGVVGVTPGITGTLPIWTNGTLSGAASETISLSAAPSTPSAGNISFWFDSTDFRFHDKNAGGSIGTTVVGYSIVSHQWLSGLNANGQFASSQPACGDISNAGTVCTQNTGTAGANVPLMSTANTWTLAQTFSASNFITLSNIVSPTTAWSLVGNAGGTAGSGNYAPFTIGSLVQKSTTVASDLCPIQDQAAAGQLKYTLCSNIGSSSGVSSFNTQTATVTFNVMPQGRLTLTSNTPVMVADGTGQGTIYYDQYNGNIVPYYTGSNDSYDTISAGQVSDTLGGTLGTGGVVATGNIFDEFWAHSGANRICHVTNGTAGGGWASDGGGSLTVRGTGYSALDFTSRSYITNKQGIAHCYNGTADYGSIAANQATYLGSFYTTGSGVTGMQFKPAGALGGTNNILGLYNGYNRVTITSVNRDSSTAAYSLTGGTWRQGANSSSYQIRFVDGLQQSFIEGAYLDDAATVSAGSAFWAATGVQLNWSSGAPPSPAAVFNSIGPDTQTNSLPIPSSDKFAPVLGFNTLVAVQAGSGSEWQPVGLANSGLANENIQIKLEM